MPNPADGKLYFNFSVFSARDRGLFVEGICVVVSTVGWEVEIEICLIVVVVGIVLKSSKSTCLDLGLS